MTPEELQAKYQVRQQLYDTMIINTKVIDTVKRRTDLMFSNQDRYKAVSHTFPNPCLTWELVAAIHDLECSQNFSKYLGNGQSLDRVTTIVPKGRGPFSTFEEGAIDALKLQGADKITDCSIGSLLYFLEKFNGFGYEKYHNMNSPYLWAQTNHYTRGKYSSDGNFDPKEVSNQIGIAILLKYILGKESIV